MSTRSKTLLIVGAGVNQLGLFRKAAEMGFVSVGVDGSPNAPGLALATHAEVADLRDPAALVRIAERYRADGIYPAAELSVEACAIAAQELGLPGIPPEVATRVRDKLAMRQALKDAGLPTPAFEGVHSAVEAAANSWDYPVIVKPADANSSKGVQWVGAPEDLAPAIEQALRHAFNRTAIIESYLDGEEFCVDGLVYQGRYIKGGITAKRMSPLPFRYDQGIFMPPMKPQAYRDAIHASAAAALRAVGFENGTFHLEVIVTADGPVVVEIAGRPGGGRIPSDLIPLTYGMDFVADSLRIALGEAPREQRRFERGTALVWFHADAGVVEDIEGEDLVRRMPGVRDVVFQAKRGDTLGETIDCVSRDRVGYVLTEGATAAEALACADAALERCRVVVRQEA